MSKDQIKLCDFMNFERFNRDAELVKATIKILSFINDITFKLFEKRLEYQVDLIYNAWMKDIENEEYFDKK